MVLSQCNIDVVGLLVLDAVSRGHHVVLVDQNSATFRLSYPDQSLPRKRAKARICSVNDSPVSGPDAALWVVDDPSPLLDGVLAVALVRGAVVLQPTVDGRRSGAANVPEPSA